MEQAKSEKSRGTFWMLLPLILLVTSSTGWLVMVGIAVDDPGFAVEPDYYKKASDYDTVVAQRGENNRLGFVVKLERFEQVPGEHAALRLKIVDETGAPIEGATVSVEALPIARAFDMQPLAVPALGSGEYEVLLERPRPGLWELRLLVVLGEDRFTQTLRPELYGPVLALGDPPS